MEVEIGRGKKGRRAYGFDDIAIVPSRRTRDPDDIDIAWTLGPYRFELPLLAAAMDGVVSPRTAGIVAGVQSAAWLFGARVQVLGFLPAFRFTFDSAAIVCAMAALISLLPERDPAATNPEA